MMEEKILQAKSDAKKSGVDSFKMYSILLLAYILFGFSHNEMFSFAPVISLIIILTEFIKSKTQRISSLVFLVTLSLPLIINATLLVYQQLLLLLMGGISAWGTDIYIQFSSDKIDIFLHSLYFINQIAIIIVSCILLILSFRRSHYSKNIALNILKLLEVAFLFVVIFMCLLYTSWNLDHHMKMLVSSKNPDQLTTNIIKHNDYEVHTVSYVDGEVTYQKMNIPMGCKFVRKYLEGVQIDNLKPFPKTLLLNYLTSK